MSNSNNLKPTTFPRIFINQGDIGRIQSGNRIIWRSEHQPVWPTKKIFYNDDDHTRRKMLIRALTSPTASPEVQNIGADLFCCGTSGYFCNSPLCNHCRTNYQDRYQKKILNTFKGYNSNDLYWLTIIDDLTYDPINHVPQWKRNFKDRIKRNMKSIFGNSAKLYGALEIDAKQTSKIVANQKAFDLLSEYGLDTSHPVAYMPHFHGIVAVQGTSASAFGDKLRDNFTKSHQISVSRLHIDKSKRKNISNMARYMFKFRYQFADNIKVDKPSYKTRFDDDTMRTYAQVIHDMKGDNGLRGFIVNHNL